MPFPVIPVLIAAGASALAARKASDHYSDHQPRRGKCTNCGKVGAHDYLESGVKWANAGPMAVALGLAGVCVLSVTARNVYKCSNCGHRTLPCRMPTCDGMALSTTYYDHELCGGCNTGNDQSRAYAEKESVKAAVKNRAQVAAQLKSLEKTIRVLRERLADVEEELRSLKGKNEKLRRQRDHLIQAIREAEQESRAYEAMERAA